MKRRKDLRWLLGFLGVVAGLWALAAWQRDTPWGVFWDCTHWTLAYLGATFLAWRSGRRSPPGSSDRTLRWGTALALGVYSLGQLAWDLQVAFDWKPFPAPSDAFFLLMAPVQAWAFYRSWIQRPGTRLVGASVLDTAGMTLGILALGLAFYLSQKPVANLEVLVLVLYPALYFGAFSFGLVLTLSNAGPSVRGRILTLTALAGTAFLWMRWNWGTLEGTLESGALLNLWFSVMALVQGWSVGIWGWSPRVGSPGWRSGVLVLLPLTGPIAGAVGLVWVVTVPGLPAVYFPVFAGLALVLLAVSMARQWVIARDLGQAQKHESRNTELEDALARLRKTQDQLVASAKLQTLGQVVAGVAHDLNTPLAAIRSSSEALSLVVQGRLMASCGAADALDSAQNAVLVELSDVLSRDREFVDSRTERQWRQRWTQEAQSRGHRDADELASVLVDLGLGDQEALALRVLALANPGPVLAALEPRAQVLQLSSVIERATEKAAGVVLTLQTYLRQGEEGELRVLDLEDTLRATFPLFYHHTSSGRSLVPHFGARARVRANPEKLAQVWVNLLTNAFQAVGPGGTVTVDLETYDGQAVVTVTDDGPGIPPSIQHRIFDAFFTTKPPGEGTGLGLEVCRRVVEELGGQIDFASGPGRTEFEVRLPLEVSDLP